MKALVIASVLFGEQPASAQTDLIQQGEYLARAGDRVACHTAKGGKTARGRPADGESSLLVRSIPPTSPPTRPPGWLQLRGLRQGRAMASPRASTFTRRCLLFVYAQSQRAICGRCMRTS